MKILFKATRGFLDGVRRDLLRPHGFATERVGFVSVGAAGTNDTLVLIARSYHPVADEDYIDDPRVGAMMGQEAIRKALNIALATSVGMFHIHMHAHGGRPRFSRTDLREQLKFVPDFFKVRREMPHGAIVLSCDGASGRAWTAPYDTTPISEFIIIAPNMRIEADNFDHEIDFTA